MASALSAAGGDVETILMPDRDHFTASLAGGEPDGPWVRNALQFITRISAKSSLDNRRDSCCTDEA
jgi:hypothetical protein